MHSLLALSASHLAWLTGCPLAANIAFEHRGVALKGLHEAIGSFVRGNSDAVLAASLLLSWQATEWLVETKAAHHIFLINFRRDWTRLMHGTFSVSFVNALGEFATNISKIIDAMQPWQNESRFEDFIAEKNTFPTAPPSPDTPFNNPKHADLDALRVASLQLRKLEAYLKGDIEGTEAIIQLINFVEGLRTLSPNHTTTQRFDMLDPLRTWLLWLPVTYVQKERMPLSAFVILAYYYTTALMVEPLFPEIGAAYFGSLSLSPIEEIARRLVSFNTCQTSQEDFQTALNLMAYPMDMAYKFRIRMGLVLPEGVALLRQVICAHHVRAEGRSIS